MTIITAIVTIEVLPLCCLNPSLSRSEMIGRKILDTVLPGKLRFHGVL